MTDDNTPLSRGEMHAIFDDQDELMRDLFPKPQDAEIIPFPTRPDDEAGDFA